MHARSVATLRSQVVDVESHIQTCDQSQDSCMCSCGTVTILIGENSLGSAQCLRSIYEYECMVYVLVTITLL